MVACTGVRRSIVRWVSGCLPGILVVFLSSAFVSSSVAAAPQMTNFVHSVGFSFDYPSKWKLKSVQEGLLLLPKGVDVDAGGRPAEFVLIGFLDANASTDPFDPLFSNAFERRYREVFPGLRSTGEIDWLETGLGTGVHSTLADRLGNRHRLYCAVQGDLGVFLTYVAQGRSARAKSDATARQIFASFNWTQSLIDPDLARSWVQAQGPQGNPEQWSFAADGRISAADRGGFYSSYDGMLNIVWDHGVEESYQYQLSSGAEGAVELEIQGPDGEARRFQ